VAEAVEGMVRLSEPVLPDPAKKAYYDARYALYCDAIRHMDAMWAAYRNVFAAYGAEGAEEL